MTATSGGKQVCMLAYTLKTEPYIQTLYLVKKYFNIFMVNIFNIKGEKMHKIDKSLAISPENRVYKKETSGNFVT